jgi:hypothetical protein
MKRYQRNAALAVVVGLFYGVLSGVQGHGFVSSVVIFVVLGLLYSALTASLYCRMAGSEKWFVRVRYSIGSAALIGFGLFGLFGLAESTVGWHSLYVVFRYAEPDPLGPGIATMVFCAGLGVFILFVDGIIIFRQVRSPSSRAAKREQGAAPNGGPATQLGNSGATEGPPSVS